MLQNAPREHSAMLSTFNMLTYVLKTFVFFFFFEWPLKTGFTVFLILVLFMFYLIHSKSPKLLRILDFLSAIRLNI